MSVAKEISIDNKSAISEMRIPGLSLARSATVAGRQRFGKLKIHFTVFLLHAPAVTGFHICRSLEASGYDRVLPEPRLN